MANGLGRAVLEFSTESGTFFKDLDKAERGAVGLGDAFKRTGTSVEGFGTQSTGASTSIDTLRGGLDQADKTLAAFGFRIGPEVQALKELSSAAGKTASQIGLIGTAALTAGAALGGWQVGRLIAGFFDLDKTIGDSTAQLLGWGDVAAETAAAKQDVLARATQHAGRAITDYTEAIRINAKAAADAAAPSYEKFTAAAAAAHREFRQLTDSQLAQIRTMLDLDATTKQVAQTLKISERAVQFLVEADKLKEEQDKRNRAETEKRTEAERRLTEAYQKQVTTIRDQLFGADAIRQAQQYLEAIGPLENVSKLNADAQARLAEIMRAGVEAMVLSGRATDDLSSKLEAMRIAATQTGRDAAAAYQRMQAEAAITADVAAMAERAMTENFVVIGGAVQDTTSEVREFRREMEAALQLLVPAGFSFEQAFRSAGFVTHGSISGLRPMAHGGIITRPTAVLAGEAGPEAFIPLGRGSSVGGPAVHFHIGTFVGSDRRAKRELARMVDEAQTRSLGTRRKLDAS